MEHHRCLVDAEILRISGTVELEAHLRELLGRDFASGELLQHHGSILLEELLSLLDALYVIPLELQPPVILELRERCEVVSMQRGNTEKITALYTWSDGTPIEVDDKALPWQWKFRSLRTLVVMARH